MFALSGVALALTLLPGAFGANVYFNDFNGPRGTTYPEWTSSGYRNTANAAGTIPSGSGPQAVTNVDSPNGKQRFLGEFGGPVIVAAPPYDPKHFVRVDETITLTLKHLKPHSLASVSFDLYVLGSWDGNNPNYGPDRWSLGVEGGAKLVDTTFSNNRKTAPYDLSLQDYPRPNSAPQTSAAAVNSLGYTFYGDSIYHLTFSFPHTGDTLILHFSSSLFEGKGTKDESWGLDNVRVSTDQASPAAAPQDLPLVYGLPELGDRTNPPKPIRLSEQDEAAMRREVLPTARTYTEDCGLDQVEPKKTVYSLFVKAGSPPSFCGQALTKKCPKTKKWVKSATIEPIALEQGESESVRLE